MKILNISDEAFVAVPLHASRWLLSGTEVADAPLMLLSIGSIDVVFTIEYSFAIEEDVHFYCKLKDTAPGVVDSIIQFLFIGCSQNTSVIENKLSKRGNKFKRNRIYSESIHIEYVSTAQQYQDVLRDRYRAYQADGRHLQFRSPDEMGNIYDGNLYILLTKIGGAPVATVRCVSVNAFHHATTEVAGE